VTILVGGLGYRADLVSSEAQQKTMKRLSYPERVDIDAANEVVVRYMAKSGEFLLNVCRVVLQGAT